MENTDAGEATKPPVTPPKRPNRLIAYIRSKLQERKAKKEKESPADRAVRVTATSTIWMAVFTFVLAFVGVVTLIEIIEGGEDTHKLAVAAGKQADAALKQLEVTYGAVVHVERPEVEPPPENGNISYRINLRLENFGKTVASDIKGVATISARSIPDNRKIGEIVVPFSVANIDPPIESTPAASVGNWIYPLPLSQETIDMIPQGKVAIVVDVLLSYNNGFETIKESVGHCSVFYGFTTITKRIDSRTIQSRGGWTQGICGPDEELTIRLKAFDKGHSEALEWANKQYDPKKPN